MQALVYTDTQTLIYREEKNPKIINRESIIKVSASGICGSDMHAYHGKDKRRITWCNAYETRHQAWSHQRLVLYFTI